MSGPNHPPTTELRVWRGGPGQAGTYDTFDVPYEEGMSVLDGLRWIRARVEIGRAHV